MQHTVYWILWLIPGIHGFERKFKYFDKQIHCFSTDYNMSQLYVETAEEIIVLNEDLVSISRMQPFPNEHPGINGSEAHDASRTATATTLKANCTLQSGSYLKTSFSRQNTLFQEIALPCNSGLMAHVLYTFAANETTYSIAAVKGHGNSSIQTRLWRQEDAENCSTDLGYALYCKVPRSNQTSFTYFTVPSAAILTERQNGSPSLFVAFYKRKGTTTYSVICEYELSTDIRIHNQISERAIPSAVWSSSSNAAVLVPMRLETTEILIVAEKDRIRMLWLPLANNTDKPQPVFSHAFNRNNDALKDLDETEVTGVLPNRNMTEIYITTDHTIFTVILDNCSPYANCTECLVSAPKYCGWCPDQNRCTFERLCDTKSKQARTKNWFDNALSNETVYCKRHNTTVPFLNRSVALPPHTVPTQSTNKATSLHRDQRSTTFPSWLDLSVEKAPRTKPIEDQVVEIVFWISVALAVVMLILVAVVSVMYHKTRKENEATFDGFKKKYPQCEGIKSYRKLKDTLWRRSMRFPYTLQTPLGEEDEGSDTSTGI